MNVPGSNHTNRLAFTFDAFWIIVQFSVERISKKWKACYHYYLLFLILEYERGKELYHLRKVPRAYKKSITTSIKRSSSRPNYEWGFWRLETSQIRYMGYSDRSIANKGMTQTWCRLVYRNTIADDCVSNSLVAWICSICLEEYAMFEEVDVLCARELRNEVCRTTQSDRLV